MVFKIQIKISAIKKPMDGRPWCQAELVEA
jgi:hypothetical protein